MDFAKVAVVTSVFRQYPMLDLCLRSHALFTPPEVMQVVADATPEGEIRAIPQDVTVVRTPGTKHGQTMHAGIVKAREMGAEWVVQSNDDLVVSPEWLVTLRHEWNKLEEKKHKVGLLGASTNYIVGPQCRVVSTFSPNGRGPVPCKLIRMFFGLHSVASYFEVGGYDAECPTSWFNDNVLSLRYVRAGYENYISECFIPHFGSQSMKGVDTGEEQAQGGFWMGRKYRGWMAELGIA